MARIRVLDAHTVNQIAAGEVVERPASVVKELCENAIDAGASAITVELREGGISYLRVTDNGCGIPREDVGAAFLRHATSKIQNGGDLFAIHTLGFRGEALASIAAVAQVDLLTRTETEDAGTTVTIHGGEVLSTGEAGLLTGTTLVVQNLFYNVPARRKFLKRPAAESAAVGELMNRLALGHPEISFRYINNDNTVLHTPGDGDQRTAAFHVYGKEAAEKLLPVSAQKNGYTVTGYVGRPELCRANRGYETLFLNGRYVRSPLAASAVEAAYKGRLMGGRFPVFLLNLTVPVEAVDVNVHPAKLEVRFREEDAVYDLLFGAAKTVLESGAMVPEARLMPEAPAPEPNPAAEIPVSRPLPLESLPQMGERAKEIVFGTAAEQETMVRSSSRIESETPSGRESAIRPTTRPGTALPGPASRPSAVDELLNPKPPKAAQKMEQVQLARSEYGGPAGGRDGFFRDYRLIGRAFDTYWLAEQGDNLYLIDQHAAHERVLFEQFLKVFRNGHSLSQPLLEALPVALGPAEKLILADNLAFLTECGFQLRETSGGVELTALPYLLRDPAGPDFFRELLARLGENQGEALENIRWNAVASMACKAAVKGGDRLSDSEARALVLDLLSLPDPFHCPHGRPTIVTLTRREIEKLFKRIV